jgi:hypothetical protein
MESHCKQYLKSCQILSTSAAFRNPVMTDQQLSIKLLTQFSMGAVSKFFLIAQELKQKIVKKNHK